ncbi:YqaA family protein [Uliginosibacterium gangwonense]|uniref:YqaA family protein n=1 Tax=Uliginosibacterium gangwonense TaxID=392736 RepID=UPI00036EB1B6|nr:YqaA family protein [Uliginosibacterium gangwonense]
MNTLSACLSLFFAAFVAATLLPTSSEALLAALLASAQYPVWLLLLVASLGNTLGSVVNWLLGRGLIRFQHKRWFPIKAAALERATQRFQRWGIWCLLLAWLPIIGDPLTLVAGVLRVRFLPFLSLVLLGKTTRYLVIAALTGWLMPIK